jgi:hypothetical protein
MFYLNIFKNIIKSEEIIDNYGENKRGMLKIMSLSLILMVWLKNHYDVKKKIR